MITGKKIAIVGFGIEGVSCANYLGARNHVFIVDHKSKDKIDDDLWEKLKVKNVKFLWKNNVPKGLDVDFVVRSPGVRPDAAVIKELLGQKTQVTSPTNIFFDECSCPVIAVTGTKGKGTTATLIYKILKEKFKDVFLAGNIGIPALDILPKLKKDSICVLELSSFQLMDLKKSPHVAVILMVTTEHLDWHKDQSEYIGAKKPIVFNQSEKDFAVVNSDFENSVKIAQGTKSKTYFFSMKNKTNGVYLRDQKIISEIKSKEEICDVSKIRLVGRHNIENVLAAVAVAKIYSVKNEDIVKVLASFKGLEHRLELVGKKNKIQFYNDSFSTTPETAIAAIESFKNKKVLILGGSSKNSYFSALSEKIIADSSVAALVLIGREAARIEESIKENGNFKGQILKGAKNMGEIVKAAQELAKPGYIVLLSPACASYDMFKNYKDRGEQFIQAVRSLRSSSFGLRG